MSSYWAGYCKLGLLIPKDEVSGFIMAYNNAHPEEEIECIYDIDNETINGCPNKFTCLYISEEMDGLTILPLNGGGWFREETESLLVYADKCSAACRILKDGFYSSKDELVDEFKKKVGDYLPEDFDFEHYIGDVSYALFA